MAVRVIIEADDPDVRACVFGVIVAELHKCGLDVEAMPFEKQEEIAKAAAMETKAAIDHVKSRKEKVRVVEQLPLDPSFVSSASGVLPHGGGYRSTTSMLGEGDDNPFTKAGIKPEHFARMNEIMRDTQEEVAQQHGGQMTHEAAKRVCELSKLRIQHFLEQNLPTMSVSVDATFQDLGEGNYNFLLACTPEKDQEGSNEDGD